LQEKLRSAAMAGESDKDIKVDVSMIAATNKIKREEIAEGRF
jgi:transcriptional regulator with GAF, ATPase, and Fis domain